MILLKGPLVRFSTTRQKKENKPRGNLGSEARLREICGSLLPSRH